MQGMTHIKKKANKFIKELNGDLNFRSIKQYCERCDFKVLLYGSDDSANNVLEALGISLPEYEKGIVYECGNHRYIFINDQLDEFARLETLLHEVGHVLLEHKASMLRKEIQECEANAFSLCVLTMRLK